MEAAPLLTDPQIAFANEVVAATKNRLAEGRAIAGMRYGELPWRCRARRSIEMAASPCRFLLHRPFHSHNANYFLSRYDRVLKILRTGLNASHTFCENMRSYTLKEKSKITAGAVTALVIVAWLAIIALALLSGG